MKPRIMRWSAKEEAMKKIFYTLAALLLVAGMTANAGATCFDKDGNKYDPVAVADATGTMVVATPTGGSISVSGFKPGDEVCRVRLFGSANRKCGNRAVRDDLRHPRFCKGVGPGGTCVHIACNAKT